jgi:hypothetical protein
MSGGQVRVHGGCVLVGIHGLLILGASGSGKSLAARLILRACASRNRFAALVADDQVHITRVAAQGLPPRLIARPPAVLAGLHEVRGLGIVRVPTEPAAVIACALELCPSGQKNTCAPHGSYGKMAYGAVQPKTGLARLPEEANSTMTILGVEIPCLKAENPGMAVDILEAVLGMGAGGTGTAMPGHGINEGFPLAFRPQHGNDKDS